MNQPWKGRQGTKAGLDSHVGWELLKTVKGTMALMEITNSRESLHTQHEEWEAREGGGGGGGGGGGVKWGQGSWVA